MPTDHLEPHLSRADAIRATMSPEQVDEYLHKPGSIRWIRAGELLNNEYGACIDGRAKEPVVGNPGGDMAILTEVAISVANQRQKPLEQTEFQMMMEWYLDRFGKFYLHTDKHGIHALEKSLNNDKKIVQVRGEFHSLEEVERFVAAPQADLQIRLLGHLLNPDDMGCGHLKQMLTDPSAYGVSRKVISGLMESYFELMWNGDDDQKRKLSYPILEGEHTEKAVVVVNFPDGVNENTSVPMIRPTDGTDSVFVVHPQVTHFMQEQVASTLVRSSVLPKMNEGMIVSMLGHMKKLHQKETQTTASRLAWGLPIVPFEVR